jgi:hypothetical protein
MPVLVVVKLPPIVRQVVVLLSSGLMNGAEVYASRMMLLLAPISASALSFLIVDNETHYQLNILLLGEMIFLVSFC